MNLLSRRNPLSGRYPAAALVALMFGLPAACFGQDDPAPSPGKLGAGKIAFQYVGRVIVDFTTGSGTVYGYLTQFANVPTASLFSGQPGESTALLTFRADVNFQPLPGNGTLGPNTSAVSPALVVPGSFKVYFTASPNRTWTDPSTFSNGVVVADFSRAGEMFTLLGAIATNTASASLQSSAAFSLDGAQINFRRLVPQGVTNITTANNTPLPGSTPVAPIFAFAGYALAIGK